MGNNKGIKILDMTNEEAKNFLMKNESYIGMNLPKYFNFSKPLQTADNLLSNHSLNDLSKNKIALSQQANVNHTVLANKNGKYTRRRLQIMHPLVYIDLINTVTKKENWNLIKNRFLVFQGNSKIECVSIPLESHSRRSDASEVILNWWERFEQLQIKYAIDYNYCVHTDISNCYGSIYTHTISWALHTKEWSKKKENRGPNNGIGNKIDSKISYSQNGQTNGIPQGNVLMDFIAEMILGYGDLCLSENLASLNIFDYKIVRYRDDYRIFSNSKEEADIILKELVEVLDDLNLTLNSNKTFLSIDIVKDAIKPDKLYWQVIESSLYSQLGNEKTFKLNIQKHLYQIKILADKYPNSGSIKSALTNLYKQRIEGLTKASFDIDQLISIVIDIMVKNPNSVEHCIVILSKFMSLIQNNKIPKYIDSILKKYAFTTNTHLLEVWLQRLSLVSTKNRSYDSILCKKVADPLAHSIWNSSWLKNGFDETGVIDKQYIDTMNLVMSSTEIDLFTEKFNIYT